MRDNIIKEKHSEGLVGYFGKDKIISFIFENYY